MSLIYKSGLTTALIIFLASLTLSSKVYATPNVLSKGTHLVYEGTISQKYLSGSHGACTPYSRTTLFIEETQKYEVAELGSSSATIRVTIEGKSTQTYERCEATASGTKRWVDKQVWNNWWRGSDEFQVGLDGYTEETSIWVKDKDGDVWPRKIMGRRLWIPTDLAFGKTLSALSGPVEVKRTEAIWVGGRLIDSWVLEAVRETAFEAPVFTRVLEKHYYDKATGILVKISLNYFAPTRLVVEEPLNEEWVLKDNNISWPFWSLSGYDLRIVGILVTIGVCVLLLLHILSTPREERLIVFDKESGRIRGS